MQTVDVWLTVFQREIRTLTIHLCYSLANTIPAISCVRAEMFSESELKNNGQIV